MRNIVFGILMYLIIGCTYMIFVWLVGSDDLIEMETNILEKKLLMYFNRTLMLCLIIDIVLNMIIWPLCIIRTVVAIVRAWV